MGDKAYEQRLRVAGDVATGSIQRAKGEVQFTLSQDKQALKVVYTGTDPLPDTFRDGAQALADGKLGQDGVFHASKIQAKCASKYEAKPGNAASRLRHHPVNKSSDRRRNLWKIWVRWLLLAFCVAIYAVVGSVVGRLKRKPFLIVSGERAVYSVWVLMTLASGILVYALMTGDFRFRLRGRSTATAPCRILYKFAAWWGGQEGSLLFWSWLLSTYAAVVVFTNRRKHRDMMPWVIGVLTTRADLLPGAEQLRREPLPDAGARTS